MKASQFKKGLPVYYRNSAGDTIPAILVSLYKSKNKAIITLYRHKRRVIIEGDFLCGPARRVVSLKNCESQSEAQ